MNSYEKKDYSTKVAITGYLSEDKSEFELVMQSEDGSPLTPQDIIDIVGDYLLVDPNGLFNIDRSRRN